VTHVLAAGLMTVLTLGFLTWYYTQTFARHSRAETERASRSKQQTHGEMALPPLGRIDPPMMQQALGPAPELPPASTFGLDQFNSHDARPYAASLSDEQAPSAALEPRAPDRRLSGPVFVSTSTNSVERRERTTEDLTSTDDGRGFRAMAPSADVSRPSALTGMLEPTATPAVQAKILPTQRLLLPKGAFVDCTLETAIDSSLPGMTTCVTAIDTFGADGSVVLLERGTKLVGETRGDVRQGSARVYVLWTEARTPDGVVVPLASPGTDELGRAGLAGDVNRHFWERFGAAILVSVIDGAIQTAAQRSSNGEGAVIVNPSTSRDVMTEVLRSTINIPPTVTKHHGDRIAVLVARDLDFRSVYELRQATAR
jgi:type IV secretion system protein VirB10